jgi:uncharacterized protein YqjF (DUF2071 family)
MSFLKAEWRKLIMANYIIDPVVLQPYIPYKTELDAWNGNHYVSLIGFLFVNTRMLGLKIPFHVNFEEVNLRFYVRYKEGTQWKRGVVFIKEIVPKPAITFVANTLYQEHYETCAMRHHWQIGEQTQMIRYDWRKKGQWQTIGVETELKPIDIAEGSEEEFITEHYWGYTKIKSQKTYEYEVTHPRWQQYPVKNYQIKCDFSLNYGSDFSFLNVREPDSVFLAEGSAITVENKRTIRL